MANLKMRADYPDGTIKLYFDSPPVPREIEDTCKLLRIDLSLRGYEIVDSSLTPQVPFATIIVKTPSEEN
jgi:hypothetical protein